MLIRKQQKQKPTKTKLTTDTLISPETKIKGDIYFSGNLYVYGKIEGNIIADDTAKATITVGGQGQVVGNIHAPQISIHGRVDGNVYASQHVELTTSSEVSGNVYYNLMQMDRGAKVNGSLLYKGENQVILTNESKKSLLEHDIEPISALETLEPEKEEAVI